MKKLLTFLAMMVMFVTTTFAATDYLCFTTNEADNSVAFKIQGSLTSTPTLQYSTDGSSWQDYEFGTQIPLANVGDKVYFKAKDKNKDFSNGYITFASTGSVDASGNIMSLLDASCEQTSVPDQAFSTLFGSASKVQDASQLKLPATTLAKYCYYGMFMNCKSLTKAPALPATTLAQSCYYLMFMGCTSLTEAPALPATTLGISCYSGMFSGCTSLTKAPALPATTLANHCYMNMFMGCTSLTETPALPATTLAMNCYNSMFSGCTSLTKAPALPATTLALNCYNSMFSGCTSLTKAPALPASTLMQGCYNRMFNGCEKLSSVSVSFTSWKDVLHNKCTDGWLDGVASTGTFTCPSSLATETRGTSYVPEGWKVESYLRIVGGTEAAIKLNFSAIGSSWTKKPTLVISQDNGVTWTDYTVGNVITVAAGTDLYVKAKTTNSTFSQDASNYIQFSSNGGVKIYGNIMTLLDPSCKTDAVPAYAFYRLFYNCTNLGLAPELPATTVNDYGYTGMFYGCTSLTTAPELPATTLGEYCYMSMFYNTSITSAPELPATTLGEYCYMSMFYNTSITSAPALPATTLAARCYARMFWGTPIKVAPALPATKLAEGCYSSMFKDCTRLTEAPELPATTLESSCYYGMFQGCTSLTTVPNLPATTLANRCYYGMFQGCSQLSALTVEFTDWNESGASTSNWLAGVAAKGNFGCPEDLDTDTRGASTVPEGWTVPNQPLHFKAEEAGATVAFTIHGTLDEQPILKYRTATDQEWQYYVFGTPITLEKVGDKVWFVAESQNETFSKNVDNYIQFSSTGKVWAGGSVISLIASACNSTVPKCAFCFLFKDCTTLTSALDVVADAVYEAGCYGMFQGCTSLTAAPRLTATTIGKYAYGSMFAGCSSLQTAPALPAAAVPDFAYQSMFERCSSLEAAPELPATSIGIYCYDNMFCLCKSLTSAPKVLPAITLADHCYANMFQGCTSLTTAPQLPALTLASNCYEQMFLRTSVNKIVVGFKDWNDAGKATKAWFERCSTTGDFVCPDELTVKYGDSYIPTGWTVHTVPYLRFTALSKGCSVALAKEGTLDKEPLLQYSTDATDWTDYTLGTELDMPVGTSIYFKATVKNATFSKNATGYLHFDISGTVAADGNTMSLLDASCQQTSVPDGAFFRLFYGCTTLTSAPRLPAPTLGQGCYANMFYGCTALTTAPELPAETLTASCYFNMFHGCSNLNSVTVGFKDWNTEGNATTNWLSGVASRGTFNSPDELAIPSTRSANTVPYGWKTHDVSYLCFTAESATKMQFNVVGTLTKTPTLEYSQDGSTWQDYTFGTPLIVSKVYFRAKSENATFSKSLDNYITFSSMGNVAASGNVASLLTNTCSIETIPNYAFANLFKGCTTLTSAPVLDAPKLGTGSYQQMFQGCSKLDKLEVKFTGWNDAGNSTTDWLDGVSETGTFTCPTALVISKRDGSHVPAGWTIVGGTVPEGLYGDVNEDGYVNSVDINSVLTVMIGDKTNPKADVNGDGFVNSVDINAILTIMIGGSTGGE